MSLAKRILRILLGIIILLGGLWIISLTLGLLQRFGLNSYGFYWLEGNFNYTALGFYINCGSADNCFLIEREKECKWKYRKLCEIGEITFLFRAIENMVLTASRKVKVVKSAHILTQRNKVWYPHKSKIDSRPSIPALVRNSGNSQKLCSGN